MAHLTYTDIDDGATRSVAAPNTFLASYQTQSTNVTAENWLDEGLDERNCASSVATDGFDSVNYGGGMGGAATIYAAFGDLVIGATTFTLTNGGLGWTVGQGYGVVHVRFALQFEYLYGATPSQTLSVKAMYGIDGGAATAVPYGLRTFNAQSAVAWNEAGGVAINVTRYRDNFKYAFLAPYIADGASHTLNYVKIQVQTGAAGYYFGNGRLQAHRLVRAVT